MGRIFARVALKGVRGLALLMSCSVAVAATATPPRQVPLTETVNGIRLRDEYRWMESPANEAEMLFFVRAENARTRAMLDALPERAWFAKRIGEVGSSLNRIAGYTRCGNVALVRRQGANDRTAKIYRRDPSGERLFLDPAQLTGAAQASFSTVTFSPDCSKVSINASASGSEVGKVYFVDVATGKQLRPPLDRMWGEDTVQFGPGDAIIYPQLSPTPGADPMLGMTTWLGSLSNAKPVAVLGNGKVVGPNDFPKVFADTLSRFAIGMASGARVDNDVYVAPVASIFAGQPQWIKVASVSDHVMTGYTRGDAIYFQSSEGNGGVFRHSLTATGSLAPGAGEIVFAGRPDRLVKEVTATRDGVYVVATNEGASELYFLRDGRGPALRVPLPFEGTIFATESSSDGAGITFGFTGWTQNAHLFRAEGGKLIDTGLESQSWDGARNFAAQRLVATSADGTKVPLLFLRRKGATGRAPTIMSAYGGYGIDTVVPNYGRHGMAWLDKGGVLAFCGTRGGGERGRTWHEGGRGANKPRAMEDLAACARTLTNRGIAPAQGPLVEGGSMGGTLVPTATERFPDAFGAMVTAVGIVNATRIAQTENGTNQFSEVGDPANPTQFRNLLAMDAYQMLPATKHLPPTMMMIGLNDHRVSPWMTAKWFARARAKWPTAPLWLRADANAGHGIGSGEDVRRDESADLYAFAWHQQTTGAR